MTIYDLRKVGRLLGRDITVQTVSKNGIKAWICSTHRASGPGTAWSARIEHRQIWYKVGARSRWCKSTYLNIPDTRYWIESSYFHLGRKVYPAHPSRKPNLLFIAILDAIEQDDRRKLGTALDEFRQHLECQGVLPDLSSSDLIEAFICIAGGSEVCEQLQRLGHLEGCDDCDDEDLDDF
jgi:hypothetical protein